MIQRLLRIAFFGQERMICIQLWMKFMLCQFKMYVDVIVDWPNDAICSSF